MTAELIEAQRRTCDQLAQVLVHDCPPWAENCWCYGEGDVRAYEAARAKLDAMKAEA